MHYCSTDMSGSCYKAGKSRHFLTKEEKIDMLQEYQEALEKEAKGVAEKISTLKKD